ncbi:MAG: hypothetical protein ACR2N4_02285 [Jatrophihabitans sp.]
MHDEPGTSQEPTGTADPRQDAITSAIREAAFAAWVDSREPDQPATDELFGKAYLGHYASLDAYVEELVDRYELDAKLDAAIAAPFRRYVDVDVTALARWLVANGTLYALPAVPIGVWVFSAEIG